MRGLLECVDSHIPSLVVLLSPLQTVDLVGLEPFIDVHDIDVVSGDKDNSQKSFTASRTVREYWNLARSKL